jgi:hypothetical protein
MLESVYAQTRKPDRLILWLPTICQKEGVGYEIPDSFLNQMLLSGVDVASCGIDWGSATKLIPTLFTETDPDTILITLDDDVVYESHAIEELVAASEKWPDASLGFMGGLPDSVFVHAEQLRLQGMERQEVGGLGGYRGILYRRKFFDGSVVEELEELLDEGPFVVDDQLFGWNLCRRGIKRFVIRTEYPGPDNKLNFRFLNLGRGIYDGDQPKLAEQSIQRLEAMYARKGWKLT